MTIKFLICDNDIDIDLTSSGLTGGLLLDMTQPICRTTTSEFLLINSCGLARAGHQVTGRGFQEHEQYFRFSLMQLDRNAFPRHVLNGPFYQLNLPAWKPLPRTFSVPSCPGILRAKLARLAVAFLSTFQLLPIGAQSLLAQLILL